MVGHLRRALGHLAKRSLALACIVAHDPQRRLIVVRRHHVEVVERPVELRERGPAEMSDRGVVVGAVREQEIARGDEGIVGGVHGVCESGRPPQVTRYRGWCKMSRDIPAQRSSDMPNYGKKAQAKVRNVMHERKEGTLRSGGSGRKVKSRKQAIAIGLSEARRAGAQVPPKKSASKKSASKKSASKKSASKKSASKKSASKKSASKKSAS